MDGQPPAGPLAGIRVLDLGTMIAGPFTATLLGDFGADVVKVELPGRGDTLRRMGPVADGGHSYWFAADARNKRSITLDLRLPAGRELLLRLVDVVDVVVENFVPGTMARWGLGADVLRARNPRLIVSHASGYGQTGPYAARPGYDRVGVAFGGLWHLTGEAGGEPMRPGLSLADYMTGAYGALGVVLALFHRDARGGDGQEVDAALYESVFRAMEYTVARYAATGAVRDREGNRGPAAPTGAFRAGDGRWLAVAVAEDAMYARLMRAIGRDDLAADPRFAHAPGRLAGRAEVEGALAEWVAARTAAEAQEALVAAEIPAALELTIEDAFTDPHYAAREMIVPVDDPLLGPIAIQGITPRLSATPGRVARPAPRMGEHNAEVYGDYLGLTAADLAALREAGVI
jgi:crotonobetainyl-CoA:carnitine CoA-transferase CaiB-like acyl-CoA transferase